MSKARERRAKRRSRQQAVRKTGGQMRQIIPEGQFQLPEFKLPGGQWLLLLPAGVVVLLVVVLLASLINPPDDSSAPNAIWVGRDWSHAERSPEEIAAYAEQLRDQRIGQLYVYVSSLREDNAWSGLADARNSFFDAEPLVQSFVEAMRRAYPQAELYAWIEVSSETSEGYRLDREQVRVTAASFSSRMVTRLGFDGVLLDVKPLFRENDDFPALLRAVRAEIGLDTPLLVTVPPDLTPVGTSLLLPDVIAPGTAWSAEYKQRIALQADTLVITAYNSYQSDPVGYMEWVAYQVEAYVDAALQVDIGTQIVVSVPDYAELLPAHDASIESLAGALDGVRMGVTRLEEDEAFLLGGVALFSDAPLSDEDWRIYREKWLSR